MPWPDAALQSMVMNDVLHRQSLEITSMWPLHWHRERGVEARHGTDHELWHDRLLQEHRDE